MAFPDITIEIYFSESVYILRVFKSGSSRISKDLEVIFLSILNSQHFVD